MRLSLPLTEQRQDPRKFCVLDPTIERRNSSLALASPTSLGLEEELTWTCARPWRTEEALSQGTTTSAATTTAATDVHFLLLSSTFILTLDLFHWPRVHSVIRTTLELCNIRNWSDLWANEISKIFLFSIWDLVCSTVILDHSRKLQKVFECHMIGKDWRLRLVRKSFALAEFAGNRAPLAGLFGTFQVEHVCTSALYGWQYYL